MTLSKPQITDITAVIKRGELVVLPTDTLYGIVASALDPAALQKLTNAKRRPAGKKFITLIASPEQLALFGVNLSLAQAAALEHFWPGPVSLIIDETAFRWPADPDLQQLLHATGPLAAPSANPDSLPPATTVEEARNYFGAIVSLYVDGGLVTGKASTLLKLEADGSTTTLRV